MNQPGKGNRFWRNLWLALRLPPPMPAKQFPVPTKERIRLDDMNGLLPEFGKTGKKHEQQTIVFCKLGSFDLSIKNE